MHGSTENHAPVPTIVFCHDDAVPLFSGERAERFGGAEMQIYELAVELSKRDDVEVRFIVDSPNIKLPSFPNITFIRYPKHVKYGLPGLGRIINRRRTEAVIPSPETSVWIHTIASPEVWTNFVRAKNLGMKFVIRISSDADIDGSLMAPSLVDQYKQVLRESDAVVAQANEQAERLTALYPSACIRVISKGISYLPSPSVELAQRNGFVWIGRCVALKRPWLFIEFARRNPNVAFTMLLGTDDRDLEQHIIQDVDRIPNLRIVCDCAPQEVQSALASSKGLIHTSTFEGGAPVVYLEAFRAACPVYSLSINPDGLFDKYPVGQYFDSDTESLLHSLPRALFDEQAGKLSTGARDYFQSHGSIEGTANLYVQLAEELARS